MIFAPERGEKQGPVSENACVAIPAGDAVRSLPGASETPAPAPSLPCRCPTCVCGSSAPVFRSAWAGGGQQRSPLDVNESGDSAPSDVGRALSYVKRPRSGVATGARCAATPGSSKWVFETKTEISALPLSERPRT